MEDRIIARERITDLLRTLLNDTEVFAPVFVGEQVSFQPIASEEDIRLDYGNSTVPPTEILMPQSETMFQYKKRGSEVDLAYAVDETKRTIFGIRPCDVHSLRMMDRVFGGTYPDPYYLTRRQNTTLISLMCSHPDSSCFCSSFGTGPDLDGEGAGADLHLVDLGDTFYVRVFSERGQQIIETCSALFAPASDAHRQAASDAAAQATSAIARSLDTEGLSEAMSGMFDSSYWDKISRKCLACGACTYLCPVCYCFDVTDTCSQANGERVRCWDACTYRSFALLSGGHNPRPTIKEGYRQKMYHKFNYAVERYGEPLCVGCGRCLDSCPVNLDIVRILMGAREEARGVV